MGRHVLQQADNVIPTVTINRGHLYWGGSPGNPIARIYGDRSSADSMTEAVREVSLIHSTLNAKHTCSVTVVDFSCDDSDEMSNVFAAFRRAISTREGSAFVGAIRQYILISSDSVYASTYCSDGVDEFFPKCPSTSPRYNGEKLRGEMRLEEEARSAMQGGEMMFTTVVLRLPDVLGSLDRSGRFWATVLWAVSGVPMLLSPTCTPVTNQLLSFVSGKDVAALVVRLAADVGVHTSSGSPSYNLACHERVTLHEFTGMVAREVQTQTGMTVTVRQSHPAALCRRGSADSSSSDLIDSSDDDVDSCSCDFYPSVQCGPLITGRAQDHLDWRPTALSEVVAEAVAFFLGAGVVTSDGIGGHFPLECRAALKRLPLIVKMALVSD